MKKKSIQNPIKDKKILKNYDRKVRQLLKHPENLDYELKNIEIQKKHVKEYSDYLRGLEILIEEIKMSI